jgi:hypothetical protein
METGDTAVMELIDKLCKINPAKAATLLLSMALDPSKLSHFTATEHYYRLNRRCHITDSAKYLAHEATSD